MTLKQCQLLGLSFEEAIGLTFTDYLDDPTGPETYCHLTFPGGTDLGAVCSDTDMFRPDDCGGDSISSLISETDGNQDAVCYSCVPESE